MNDKTDMARQAKLLHGRAEEKEALAFIESAFVWPHEAQLNAMTDAEIERAVATDPDTFFPDDNWWAKARARKATKNPRK